MTKNDGRHTADHLLSAAENAGTAAGRLRLPEKAELRRSFGVSGEVGVSGMKGFGPGLVSSSPARSIHYRFNLRVLDGLVD